MSAQNSRLQVYGYFWPDLYLCPAVRTTSKPFPPLRTASASSAPSPSNSTRFKGCVIINLCLLKASSHSNVNTYFDSFNRLSIQMHCSWDRVTSTAKQHNRPKTFPECHTAGPPARVTDVVGAKWLGLISVYSGCCQWFSGHCWMTGKSCRSLSVDPQCQMCSFEDLGYDSGSDLYFRWFSNDWLCPFYP